MSTAAQVAVKLRALALTRGDAKLALQAGALQIEGRAKELAPYRTGSLRRDIGTEIRDDGDKVRALIGNSKAIPYAAHQEFGTSRGVRPRAYLRGALREKATDAIADVAAAFKRLLAAKAKA